MRLRRRKLGEADIIDAFHRQFYRRAAVQGFRWTTWLGHVIVKYPADLFVVQEILVETRPDLVVETGTFRGGSALFLATVMDAIGCGQVLTIDTAVESGRPAHPRIQYLTGSSTAPATVQAVEERARTAARVMVVLDSDHTKDHVLAELDAYSPLVTPGCYLVVEDTNVNGHPIMATFGPGPMEAVTEFLAEHPEFDVDASREKFLVTWNPSGYLRRIS